MMKIQAWIAAAAIAAAAASPAAQDRTASPAPAGKVTVTGCVERADQILSRETLGTTLDSLSFVLIKAQDGKASDQPQPAPAAGQQAEGKTYRLDVDVDTINRHVGHRVEITATTTQDAQVGTSGRADAASANPVVPPPVLKVESVKMLSPTCSR